MKLFTIGYDHELGTIDYDSIMDEVILAENKEQALEMCSYPPSEMNEDQEDLYLEDFWTVEEIDINKAQVVLSSCYKESPS